MSVNSSPPSDATATSPGLIAPGAQQVPSGSKTFQDLLVLAGNWSRVVDPGTGPETLTGEPIELGDFSGGTYSDLLTKPGLRRFTFGGVSTAMVLGTLGFGVLIDETNAKLELNGQIDTVSADAITATTATFGGVNLLDSSGLTIVGGSISAPLAIITDIDVTNLTIGGVPYAAPIIDTVNTATGLYVTGSTLKLFEANGSTPGAMTPNAQTFAGAKTFSDLLTANSGVVTPTISSASGVAVSSSLGAGATDIMTKVGSSNADGSVNPSAKLLSIVLGIGGTEVSTAWFTKYGLNLDGRGASNTSPLIFTNLGAGTSGIVMNKSSGGSLEFTEGNYNWGNNLWQIRSTNRPIAISVVGNAYVPGRPQALLLSANYDWTVPVVRVAASAGHTGSVWAAAVGTTDVALVSASGRIDQSGTDSSGTPGNATINKPTGKSAIASGATTVTITNSNVAAGDNVHLTWHGDLGAQSKIPWVDTSVAGKFTVNVGNAPSSNVAFCWTVQKRI